MTKKCINYFQIFQLNTSVQIRSEQTDHSLDFFMTKRSILFLTLFVKLVKFYITYIYITTFVDLLGVVYL